MKTETLETLPIGTRVHYTGDCCTHSATGTITEHSRGEFGDSVLITWDSEDGHFNDDNEPVTVTRDPSWISPRSFETSIGRRFYRLENWREEEKANRAAMAAEYCRH